MIWNQRTKESVEKQPRVQKRGIFQPPALGSITRVHWEHFAGNLFRYFEAELEAGRHLPEQLPPEVFARKLVEREVAAHRRKHSGVLSQAALFKRLLRELATMQIPRPVVDLIEPSLVLPGAAADEDTFRSQAG